MSSHPLPPHDHDALLEALATGDLDPASERARSELAQCAECRAQAELLLARVRRLEAAGREQRQELAEARALASAPGEDRVERALALAGAEPRRRRPRAALLTAAAVLVAAAGWWLTRGTGEAPPGPGAGAEYLGGAWEDLFPMGPGQSFEEFRWTYEGEAAGGFELRIYDPNDPDSPILQPPKPSSPWKPTPEQRLLLPEHIEWYIDALDAFGEVESSVHTSASRSSH